MSFFLNSLHLLVIYQIVLESFPVSSSGHMILVEKLAKITGSSLSVSLLSKNLDYFLHGPTILILLIFFRKEWLPLFKNLIFHFSFSYKSWSFSYKKLMKFFTQLVSYVLIADIITGMMYLLIVKLGLRSSEFIYANQMLLIGFVISALSLFSLIFLDDSFKKTFFLKAFNNKAISLEPIKGCDSEKIKNEITWSKVIILGIVQGFSCLPGISRFGTTFVAARWLGFSSRRSFQFSFLMFLPLMIFAFSKFIFKAILNPDLLFFFDFKFFTVLLVATIVAYFGLYFSWSMIKYKKFWIFGFYLILPIFLTIGFLFFS